jgi:hypothetical protein
MMNCKKKFEGSGRGLIEETIPAFAWDWGKPRKPSARLADLRTDIWTQYIQSTKES